MKPFVSEVVHAVSLALEANQYDEEFYDPTYSSYSNEALGNLYEEVSRWDKPQRENFINSLQEHFFREHPNVRSYVMSSLENMP